ncbi:glycosyltransferase family 58 protein [Myriangium duriaei CBS 260.36]|uniref:Dol-P-Man:Man(5)GlcNAc(2)-PP-Dol alpha-1,3-mannosyltransferase n=1 Tax=Myriangium duriaei CBS 260.36 TaxID=1168546 RepID=A0A9P4J4T0_9PEZI|nr:glycosyltransferase family 58 protein [Myriangium duriaei CBS 260.36]
MASSTAIPTATELYAMAVRIATNPWHTAWLCPLLLVADAGLTGLVVKYIPYTEIDWRAYMQQVSQIEAGERNYAKIRGDTGPLVYPAGHVWIYRALAWATDAGKDIAAAQLIFAALYLATLATVMLCYRRAKVPPWVYLMLVCSKRLHSVYVLRLFNDCWAVLGLWVAIALFQSGHVKPAALAFSLGLAVKMSLLLALPAVAVLLYLFQGPWGAVGSLFVMTQYQILVAWPFLVSHPKEYLAGAFEFSRVFMFKWTVNWRFLGEETFLSKEFSTALLVVHGTLLAAFVIGRWIRPAGMNIWQVAHSFVVPPSRSAQNELARRVTPDFVLSTVLAANVVGMLCARSLHYQFYSWLAWGTPYLLWRSGWPYGAVVAIWVEQELSWNKYPSSTYSSAAVVVCLAAQVLGVWRGTGREPKAGEVSHRRAKPEEVAGAGRNQETVKVPQAASSPSQKGPAKKGRKGKA